MSMFIPISGVLSQGGVSLPSIGTALNDCTWEEISLIAASGQAANYWAIGDCKAITLDGTVGTISVSGTYYVYIIGFDHNGATNTIDFGTFKTALTGGTDVCLIDGYYDTDSLDGSKYFNMNHWGSSSSPYNTNYGGWSGCDLRYDILGSTDIAPSGYGSMPSSGGVSVSARTGYDASTTCATNPVVNTLMAALPSDLRAVMKPMTIYTDNVGTASTSDNASRVSISVDYLPLLAEFEIFGKRSYANSSEQNYQSQYTYYSVGNSKNKFQYNETASYARWQSRSPRYNNAYNFCAVGTGSMDIWNNSYVNDSRRSCGLAPIFRV